MSGEVIFATTLKGTVSYKMKGRFVGGEDRTNRHLLKTNRIPRNGVVGFPESERWAYYEAPSRVLRATLLKLCVHAESLSPLERIE